MNEFCYYHALYLGKGKRKRLHLEQRQGNNSFGFDWCMLKRCLGKQKQCWVNCNFTGLFVLDNSCNGGIVVQSHSVDFPPAFNTPPTNGCMYGRKEDSWQNCPLLKGPVKWNIWPWSRSRTHTIYRPPPSSADTVPLRLSFSI